MKSSAARSSDEAVKEVAHTVTPDESAIERLRARVERVRNEVCCVCRRRICGHEILFSIALGYADQPRCVACAAAQLSWTGDQLRDHLLGHFQHRECYATVWKEESEREGFGSDGLPPCVGPDRMRMVARGMVERSDAGRPVTESRIMVERAEQVWDAGDMACGDLVLELRRRVNALPPGTCLQLIAHDSGAAEDIPAWCRLTGNPLIAQQHPNYWIQRKD